MSFTYENLNFAASVVSKVRFLVGDNNAEEFFLHDEEIEWLVEMWEHKGSVYFVASMAAEAIAAKFAREISITADSQSLSAGELQQKYLSLAEQLMRRHETLLTGAELDVGGINAGQQPDPTVTSPAFGTGMHDFYEAGNQDQGDRGPVYSPEWRFGEYW